MCLYDIVIILLLFQKYRFMYTVSPNSIKSKDKIQI